MANMAISFQKYHGVGNDFIMINNLKGEIKFTPDYIKFLCDRHFGIGADGVILLEPSNKADCFMNYYNSDGTEAEMCGNGVRCAVKFFLEQTKSDKNELYIDTRAGIKKLIKNNNDTYLVNMGMPVFEHQDFPSGKLEFENSIVECVSVGNPHAVTFVDNIKNIDAKSVGSKIENDFHFPNKINVEFVEKISDNYYKVKMWERGCGETLACGTGACAVYAILKKNDPNINEITLEFQGGKLYLSGNHEDEIILRGPAEFVFKGEII